MNWKLPHKFSRGVFDKNECACGLLKGSPLHVKNKLGTGKQLTRPISKKVIKQAVEYSNLSQWIQMEFFKYAEIHKRVRVGDMVEPAHNLADRIIKKVLEYKDGKTSRKNS